MLAQKLRQLTPYQERLIFRNAIPHIAKCTKDGTCVCLDCGHSWKLSSGIKKVTCPHCGAKLKVDTSLKRTFREQGYAMKIECHENYQVLRAFYIDATFKKSKQATYFIGEAFQRWIDKGGSTTIVSRMRCCSIFYYDLWSWDSKMEIRRENQAHTISIDYVLGRMSILPELKRNGFDGKLYDCNPAYLFPALLSNPKIETMLKANQISLMRYFARSTRELSDTWASVKVSIRHNYIVEDASMWCDLISTLLYLGKDVHNPDFVCPDNLQMAHDYWQRIKDRKRAKEIAEQERERIRKDEERYLADKQRVIEDEQNYKHSKSRFFDIELTDDEITIRPLQSVKEFMMEASELHHCVFSNKYYNKADSLILHAIVDGKPMETIEIDLGTMEIVQCRGLFNKSSEYHDRILKLMSKNMGEVARRIAV